MTNCIITRNLIYGEVINGEKITDRWMLRRLSYRDGSSIIGSTRYDSGPDLAEMLRRNRVEEAFHSTVMQTLFRDDVDDWTMTYMVDTGSHLSFRYRDINEMPVVKHVELTYRPGVWEEMMVLIDEADKSSQAVTITVIHPDKHRTTSSQRMKVHDDVAEDVARSHQNRPSVLDVLIGSLRDR